MKNLLLKKINIKYLLFLFFTTSILCWFFEILYSLLFRSKLVLPGALYGPWCPVYGCAFISLYLCINLKENKIINFFKVFILVVMIEYLASLVSEYVFGRIIWDYSEFFMNINGRVCLYMSLFFSLVAFIAVVFIEPLIYKIYKRYPKMIRITSYLLIVLFSIDLFLSLLNK